MNGLKRLLNSSRSQFAIAAVVATLAVCWLKWPTLPEGTLDEQAIVRLAEVQRQILSDVFTVLTIIVAVLTGGTSLEDAAKKLFGRQ